MPGIEETLHEFKQGKLHSGSKHGPRVTSRKQAIAIALNQARKEHRRNNSERHAHMNVDGSIRVPHSRVK